MAFQPGSSDFTMVELNCNESKRVVCEFEQGAGKFDFLLKTRKFSYIKWSA